MLIDSPNFEPPSELELNTKKLVEAAKNANAAKEFPDPALADIDIEHLDKDSIGAFVDFVGRMADIRSLLVKECSEADLDEVCKNIILHKQRLEQLSQMSVNEKNVNAQAASAFLRNKINNFYSTAYSWQKHNITFDEALDYLREDYGSISPIIFP